MMRKNRIEKRSALIFWMITIGLVLIITFCVTQTVYSQSDIAAQELENYYRTQEKQLLQETKDYLTEKGFANSGVTLTRVVDETGKRDYTFTIHHGKIDRMSEAERMELAAALNGITQLEGNCTFCHEFLMYD